MQNMKKQSGRFDPGPIIGAAITLAILGTVLFVDKDTLKSFFNGSSIDAPAAPDIERELRDMIAANDLRQTSVAKHVVDTKTMQVKLG